MEQRLSGLIAGMSRALDLADGHVPGHAARSCLIGMRLADELQLDPGARSSLFYALLLKDAGCSSNAAKVAALYGADDRRVKGNVKAVDHKRPGEALRYIWSNVGGATWIARVQTAARVGLVGPRTARQMTEIRCERGAHIATLMGFEAETAGAVRALDEHWNGRGHPLGLRGKEIPLAARILNLAQCVEVFRQRDGLQGALSMAQARAGRWFDPELVRALAAMASDHAFWRSLDADELDAAVSAREPAAALLLADDERLDRVAEAFALVVDAKSPYTFRHSTRVAELALAAAREAGLAPARCRRLRRAALLHDIGKLGVSNRILDKPGPLDPPELAAMRRHTLYTAQILERVDVFRELAPIAAAHHEKLDGSGYHRGLQARALGTEERLLAVADVFEALTAQRPYRAPLPPEQALAAIAQDSGRRLCGDAFVALRSSVEHTSLASAA